MLLANSVRDTVIRQLNPVAALEAYREARGYPLYASRMMTTLRLYARTSQYMPCEAFPVPASSGGCDGHINGRSQGGARLSHTAYGSDQKPVC